MNKKIAGIGLASIAVLSLAACGHRGASKSGGKSDSLKVAMVTDTGGVDDKSFNQSGWEGMQAWARRMALKKELVLTISNRQVNLIMQLT